MSAKPPLKVRLCLIETSSERCCHPTPAPCAAAFPTAGLAWHRSPATRRCRLSSSSRSP